MVSASKWRFWFLFQLAAIVSLIGITVEASSAQENFGIVIGSMSAEDTGNPLFGGNILVVGTALGALSRDNGSFIIDRVPPGTYQIEFSFLGYKTTRMSVTVTAGERVAVNGRLGLDPLMLDEVVVTGYGAVRKEQLTGSLVLITAKDLTLLPTTTFQDVIQGQPGILVTTRDGSPGAGINIRVRGIGSITAGSEPLYVVDGMPLFNETGNGTEIGNGGRTANTLASLNPNDIESIVVLKDAASTAIYGSRGANGVVLITTKGGVAGSSIWSGAPRFELKTQFGVSDYAFNNLLQGLNADEYREYFLSSRTASGMSLSDAQVQLDAQWPVQENNIWSDIISQKGLTNQFDLSATGGSARFTYFLSAGLFDQEGNVKEQFFTRYSSRINLSAQLTDRFRISNNLSVAKTEQNGINDGSAWEAPFYMAIFMPPVLPMFDEEGEWYAKHRNVMGANHPLGGLFENPKWRDTNRIIDNITGTFKINDNFTVSSAWSFDIYEVHDYVFQNGRFGDGRNTAGFVDDARFENVTWQGTHTLGFNDVFSQVHNVDAIVGYEASKSDRSRVNGWGTQFAHPDLMTGQSAAVTESSASESSYSFESLFARVNYDYDRTYFLSGSFRRDGSSRFGPDRRYGNFWAVGAGYTLTNGDFAPSFFDYLKLRGSYGEIGNADIGNYEWQGLYGFTREYNNLPGSSPSQVSNRLLTWESQESFNIGVDYAMLDNRVTGTVEYYKKNSKDLLLNVPTSLTTGFSSTLQNFGDMENSGVEFSVQASVLRTTDYDLSVNFNVTSQSNEITKLGEPFVSGTKRREVGRDYQEYYLYGWAGVDPANGKPQYYTDASKTTITSKLSEAERFYDGKSASPDYLGSFGFRARYKRLSVSTVATYMLGHYLYEGAERFYHGDGRYLPRSTSRWAWENSWKQPGDDALFPQQRWGGNSGSQPSNSDRWLSQGDYVRFKDVTVAYQFPESVANMARLASLGAHLTVANAFTWVADGNLHFDPEQTISGVYNTGTPNSKTLSFGLTMGF